LNDRAGVSEELRGRIKAIAERMQYAPYIKSRENGMMASGVHQIAVIYDRHGGHLFDEIQRGIDASLSASGFREIRFTIQLSEMLQESSKKIFMDKLVNDPSISGTIFVFIPLTDGDIAQFSRRGIHVVQLNVESDFGQCVAIDNFSAAYEATKKFIDLGHATIGFVLPNDWVSQVWRDRLAGYKKAIADHGLDYDGSWIGNESSFQPKQAGYVTHELLINNPNMTAILYGSDIQALGGLKILREMHLRVPDDVSVIGFDDMQICELVDPPLGSVHLPMAEQGKIGTEMLLQALGSESFKNEKRILKAKVVLRRSADKTITDPRWLEAASPQSQEKKEEAPVSPGSA